MEGRLSAFLMGRKKGLFMILGLLSLLGGGLFPLSVLEVRDGLSGEVLYQGRAGEGETFEFTYVHSVEKSPVGATFLIEEGRVLRIVETRFFSHGPGLPNETKTLLRKEGEFVVEGGGKLDRFSFFYSSDNRPVLKLRDREILIENERRGTGRLEISVKGVPFLLHALTVLRLTL